MRVDVNEIFKMDPTEMYEHEVLGYEKSELYESSYDSLTDPVIKKIQELTEVSSDESRYYPELVLEDKYGNKYLYKTLGNVIVSTKDNLLKLINE